MNRRAILALVFAALAGLFLVAPVHATATITIVNADGPGEGFNDPTPAAPVGGNAGTTLGEQRLIAFQHAADLWGAVLDSSIPIEILASFDPLSCNATSAVLGSAGTQSIFANFPGAPLPNTWYSGALANKLAGFDLYPPPSATNADKDIRARFNVNLGNPGCLTGIGWYLGLDDNHGSQIDLVTVLLHEFAHGLGFQQFASLTSGAMINDFPDAYNRKLLDLSSGKTWDQMTNAERAASAVNSSRVVWNGGTVTSLVPSVLAPGTPVLKVNSPASVAGVYAVGAASFGPPLSSPGVTGDLALALDGAGTTTDACESIINPGDIAGRIAVVDRGTCTFVIKVKNAQDAGAIAVIVVDNVPGSPPAGLGGSDPTITIPAVRITLADGIALKAAMASGTVNATLGVDLSVLAGASPGGQALMNAPNPVQPGSSISHWDPIAFPNQLMEPAINSDLTHAVDAPVDLTRPLLADIGWVADTDGDGIADDYDCEPNSDLSPTFTYASCNSGVPNIRFPNGCTLKDVIVHLAASAANHGDLTSSVTHLLNDLVAQGLLDQNQKGKVLSCVASAKRKGNTSSPTDGPVALTVDRFAVRFAARNPGDGARLEMALPSASPVSVNVYDVRGALVWSLSRTFDPGVHAIAWDGRDGQGRQLPGGVYFIRTNAGAESATLRFVMIR